MSNDINEFWTKMGTLVLVLVYWYGIGIGIGMGICIGIGYWYIIGIIDPHVDRPPLNISRLLTN